MRFQWRNFVYRMPTVAYARFLNYIFSIGRTSTWPVIRSNIFSTISFVDLEPTLKMRKCPSAGQEIRSFVCSSLPPAMCGAVLLLVQLLLQLPMPHKQIKISFEKCRQRSQQIAFGGKWPPVTNKRSWPNSIT